LTVTVTGGAWTVTVDPRNVTVAVDVTVRTGPRVVTVLTTVSVRRTVCVRVSPCEVTTAPGEVSVRTIALVTTRAGRCAPGCTFTSVAVTVFPKVVTVVVAVSRVRDEVARAASTPASKSSARPIASQRDDFM